jgi:hypothetical protein
MPGTADRVAALDALLDVVAVVRAGAVSEEEEAVADELLSMVAPVMVAVVVFDHVGRPVHLPDTARVARALAAKFRSRRVAARVVRDVLAELEAAA